MPFQRSQSSRDSQLSEPRNARTTSSSGRYFIVSIGTANYAVVTPREVYQRAIVAGVIAVAVAHNHPSSSPLPSDEDHKVNKRLFECGVLLGIKFLDHVVVTDYEHDSFSENGVP